MRTPLKKASESSDLVAEARTVPKIRKLNKQKRQRGLHTSLLAIVETFPVKHLYENKMSKLRATVVENDSSGHVTPHPVGEDCALFAKVVAHDNAALIHFSETVSENDASLHVEREELEPLQEEHPVPRSAPPGLVSKIDNAQQAKIKLDSLDYQNIQ